MLRWWVRSFCCRSCSSLRYWLDALSMLSFSFRNDSRCCEARQSCSCKNQNQNLLQNSTRCVAHRLMCSNASSGLHGATNLHLSIKGFSCTLLLLLRPLQSPFLLLNRNMRIESVQQGPLSARNPPLAELSKIRKLSVWHTLKNLRDGTMGG